MKFTRSLLSTFIDISNINNDVLSKTLNDIGLEVEARIPINIPSKVVIGCVVEKFRHPDADKLNICKVDVGSETLDIVCGAKNVAKGQFVPVALVGAKLGDLTISQATIRGVESSGMICSSSELGLPKVGDGIFVLDSSIGELVLGKELSEYAFANDNVFEVGVTPNRGDYFSLIGIARDLAAVFNLHISKIREREANHEITPGIGRILNVSFEHKIQSSLSYKVVELDKLSIDAHTKLHLALCDLLDHDDLISVINFVTYMTGVLINAYKFDSYVSREGANKKIYINVNKESDGIESVYCGDDKLCRIGIETYAKYQANQNSRLVVFEASFIPPRYISELAFNSGINADTATFYLSKRGTSPLIKDGMEFLCATLRSMSESIVYTSSQDIIQDYPLKRIDCSFNAIASIIGNDIKQEVITDLLKRIGFNIQTAADDSFIAVSPPSYRHDIASIQDIAEEILRLVGIDNIKPVPQRFVQYKNINSGYVLYKLKRSIAARAISRGFFECLHYVFCNRDILSTYGYETLKGDLEILNPINTELNTLRTSLIPNMLSSVSRNKNYGYTSIKLFEMGSIYNANREEHSSLAFVVSGNKNDPVYPYPKGVVWDFYSFAHTISGIIGPFTLEAFKHIQLYHDNVTAKIIQGGTQIGYIGKLNPFVAKDLDISNDTFICEIDCDQLFLNSQVPMFKEFSRFQASQRDITLVVDSKISFADIKYAILNNNFSFISSIFPLDIYTDDKLNGKVSLSFRIVFQSIDKTLNEDDLRLDGIINLLKDQFGAELR